MCYRSRNKTADFSTTLLLAAAFYIEACSTIPSSSDRPRQPSVIQEPVGDGMRAPKMVLVPAGEFMMGSPRHEDGRYEDEGPQHKVTFSDPFYLAQTPVTVGQFRDFVQATDYRTAAEQHGWSGWRNPVTGEWEKNPELNWRYNHRGELNGDDYPVLHVSWDDANAYAQWLSEQTGHTYRLPSESEMEYANRAGTTTAYWWGNGNPGQQIANLKGEQDIPENDKTWFPTPGERQYAYAHGYTPFFFEDYGDGYWGPSPVASFKGNAFDLHDTTGNVWEWTADCWHGSYHGAPDDGSAWIENGVCTHRVVRGGSYYCFPRHVRSANRWKQRKEYRGMYIGFRVARDISNR
ncbi:MAG: formylglycine-generating enzyme family protein [Gammaproteobacteria bacterium]